MICRGLAVADLVVGVKVGEGRKQRGLLGISEFGDELGARHSARDHRVAKLLAQVLVHRRIAAHQRIAHTVGLGDQLAEFIVGIRGDRGRLRRTRTADFHASDLVVAVVTEAADDAIGIRHARDAVRRVEAIARALAALVDGLDFVAVAVKAVFDGVAHRFRQPGDGINNRSARGRVKHTHARRHLEAQPVVAVVHQIRDVVVSVLDAHHVAGSVVEVTGDIAFGVRDADALVLGVIGIGRGLALRDLELQPSHHRQQVLVLVVAVLRDLTVGRRLQTQQPVTGVLVAGGIVPVVRLGDQVAFEIVGECAGVLHRRSGRIAVVIDRCALDLDQLAPGVVGIRRRASLGIRHAGAVAHVVVAHRRGARARRIGVQR